MMAQQPGTPQQLPTPPRRRRQGIPTGAIILVIVGVVLLMQTTGVVSWDLWLNLWRFWPVLIIAIGINIFMGCRMWWLSTLLVAVLLIGAVAGSIALTTDDEPVVTTLTESLDGLSSMDLSLTFAAGDLIVRSLRAGSPNLVEGRFETPGRAAQATLTRSGDTGVLSITMEARSWSRWFSNADWDISLSQSPSLSIDLDGGAASMNLDLRDLRVTNLDIDVGAASVDVTLPASAGEVSVGIDAGAASIKVIVPEGIAAKISKDAGLSSFDIDASRFPKSNGVYVSPDFDTAENRVTIDFNVGASSVTVR